jgi:hypothetical protein
VLRDRVEILCYVARLSKTYFFFQVVCKQSVIYFDFLLGGCVGGAVLKFSVSENLHSQRYNSFNCLENYKTSEEMC